MAARDSLFSQINAFSLEHGQRKKMQAEIADFDANRLLNTNVDDLVNYFAAKYRVDVPNLVDGEMAIDPEPSPPTRISCGSPGG